MTVVKAVTVMTVVTVVTVVTEEAVVTKNILSPFIKKSYPLSCNKTPKLKL